MKTYTIITESSWRSTKILKEKVEKVLNEKTQEGYEIASVSFGVNYMWKPTAYITLCK